jgi:hypothetical protein
VIIKSIDIDETGGFIEIEEYFSSKGFKDSDVRQIASAIAAGCLKSVIYFYKNESR